MTKEQAEEMKEIKEKFIKYFGDDKPKSPLQFIKAAIELKIEVVKPLIDAIERVHGKKIWKLLGGKPLILKR